MKKKTGRMCAEEEKTKRGAWLKQKSVFGNQSIVDFVGISWKIRKYRVYNN